jgi:hypothetical protein
LDFRKHPHKVQATALFVLVAFSCPIIIIITTMTPLQDFMAAAGFLVEHGDSQTMVSIVSDNAKGGLKVRTSSTVAPSTPVQNIWLVSSKPSTSTANRVCKWQSSEDSFASDMTEPDSPSSLQESRGSPRSPPVPSGTIMVQEVLPLTDHRPPPQEPDQERKEQNNKMPLVVVKEESNADHQEGAHITRGGPLNTKLMKEDLLAYPSSTAAKGQVELGHCSPTQTPAAA